nr:hypothetical protein [Methanobrevibacter arboriphilus]
MATLPYKKKEFQVHNTRDYCEVNQKHDEDKPPRTIATFEQYQDIDYKKLAQMVADELNKTSDW